MYFISFSIFRIVEKSFDKFQILELWIVNLLFEAENIQNSLENSL